MTNRIRGTHAVALAVFAIAAPAAAADPVSINLRVEGQNQTIFDGPVTTDGHHITTPSGGPHPCDGTNNGAHPSPGPTATAALDDGARLNNFTWDGDWFPSFNDFLVTRVAGEAETSSQFWYFAVNFKLGSAGGCQTRVNQGDEVVWIFDAFSKAHFLKLTGPGAATTGAPVTVSVTDGGSAPVSGATVGGAQTGADGNATLSFAEPGIYRLKAERADSVRSNSISVCVDPPGADPCTSSDKAAPRVLSVDLPGRELVSERGRSRTMVVSWQADDGDGSGVATYAVDVREMGSGLRASKVQAGEWRSITERTVTPSARFRGESGKAYQFRVTAVDRATNRGTGESNTIVMPVDDRDRKLLRFSRGWTRTPLASAWGETVRRTTEAGPTATLRFKGRRVSLIGRRLPKGGRLRLTVGGRSKVVNLRGRSAPRRVLWTSRRMRDGAHVLRIRSLGGGPVEVDAVAPRP
jgi:Fibronectin type III domain